MQSLSTSRTAIIRNNPQGSYTSKLLEHYFGTIDAMAKHPNTLGFIIADQVINNVDSTMAAPTIRAVVRDVKKYMKLAAVTKGQSEIPVGITTSDLDSILKPQFDYFVGGDGEEEAIDFFCVSEINVSSHKQMIPVSQLILSYLQLNCYSPQGEHSAVTSRYNSLVRYPLKPFN